MRQIEEYPCKNKREAEAREEAHNDNYSRYY
jgi:hypothetical protein